MKKTISETEQNLIIISAVATQLLERVAGASIPPGESANAFRIDLLNDYNKSRLESPNINWITSKPPSETIDWLRNYLKGKFRSHAISPHWLGEAQWMFLNGQPMEFVGQMKHKNKLSSNGEREVYTFGAYDEKFEKYVYRTCYQEKDENGEVVFGLDAFE